MGDRWVENFVTEFFAKIGKNAVHCKKYLKSEEICSALQISKKSFVYLQRNAFFSANIRLKYDRAQGIHGSSGKMERQESDKGGYWHQAMRQIFFVEDVSGEASG